MKYCNYLFKTEVVWDAINRMLMVGYLSQLWEVHGVGLTCWAESLLTNTSPVV